MLEITVVLFTLSIVVTLLNWRLGIFCFLIVGFLQDPLRKLAVGHSVYFVLGAGVMLSFVMISAWSRITPHVSLLFANNRQLEQAWKLFFVVCAVQIAHTAVRWGNPYLVTLGVLTYVLPVGALILGIHYAKSVSSIERFLKFYCCLAVVFALTVYFSYWFSDYWKVLQDIGVFSGRELRIYGQGTVLNSNPGLFRVGEIAAWHGATGAALCIAYGLRQENLLFKLFLAGLVVALIGAIILTGRRKMLVTIIIFAGSYGALLLYLRQGLTRNVLFMGLAAVCASALIIFTEPDASQLLYIRHSISVFDQLYDRVLLAVQLLYSGLWKFDFVGAGAGVSAQGSQYFGGGAAIVGGSSESGLGKLSTELGAAGIIAAIFLGLMLVRHLLVGIRYVSTHAPQLTEVSAALFSLLIANTATFLVATQVYGDLFVILLLGLFTGFLFAVPWLAYQNELAK